MLIALGALAVILALGWWHYRRKAAVVRSGGEDDAHAVPGRERAHELAQLQSDLSRLKGWTPTGS